MARRWSRWLVLAGAPGLLACSGTDGRDARPCTIVPADGLTPAVITITMNDGAGHTVPASARQINLTSDLGTLADNSVIINSSGNGSTQLTSTAISAPPTVRWDRLARAASCALTSSSP